MCAASSEGDQKNKNKKILCKLGGECKIEIDIGWKTKCVHNPTTFYLRAKICTSQVKIKWVK